MDTKETERKQMRETVARHRELESAGGGGRSKQMRETIARNRALQSAAKFKELANKRVRKAIKQLGLIGNLASYRHTQDQVNAIDKALQTALDEAMMRFATKNKDAREEFHV